MKLHHVAWMLVFTLCCITSVLGYREWQRYCGAEQMVELTERVDALEQGPAVEEIVPVVQQIYAKASELDAKVKALEAEDRPCDEYTGMVKHARMQTIANIANIVIIANRIEKVNDRLSDLIDKLSTALPNGAYILPPRAEMDKFSPNVVIPPDAVIDKKPPANPESVCPGLGPAPMIPDPFCPDERNE